MKKIKIILTGGTIGSTVKNKHISIGSENQRYKIIELYNSLHPSISFEIIFEILEPYTLLSENLNGKYLNSLIECVKNNLTKECDGIIITHGTDTLQYSAAALGLVFQNTDVPMLFVSSNYVLDDPRANGLKNFELAVEYILNADKSGVFVSYNGEILNSLSLLAHMTFSDNLYHINGKYECSECLPSDSDFFKNITLTETAPILFIKAVPGQLYPDLNSSVVKAILLETYHSGTLCTESTDLVSFCEKAYNNNIPIYVVGVENRIQYESTAAYDRLHLNILKCESPITAYMKLWFIFSKK